MSKGNSLMTATSKILLFTLNVSLLIGICTSRSYSQTTHYVITNDDNPLGNTATFFSFESNGALAQQSIVNTGGFGSGNGYFAAAHVTVARTASGCIYVSNAGSVPGSVSGIVESTMALAGTFGGSSNDTGGSLGIGLAVGNKALYAAFTGSGTIGVFRLHPDCTLTLKQDVAALGLIGGSVDGMKVHGNILVVAYGDGSVSSFNILTGIPISNNDLQQTSGFLQYQGLPAGVDISSDGHWAIFGDASKTSRSALVEVADISSGKIGVITPYLLGTGLNSNNVWLSPDNTLLYVSNNYSGQITGAFFNRTTGGIGTMCISPVLKNFGFTWVFGTGISTAITSGTGQVIYVGEWGNPSGIGIVNVSSNGSSCTLTESASSPVSDPQSGALSSISVFPPRKF